MCSILSTPPLGLRARRRSTSAPRPSSARDLTTYLRQCASEARLGPSLSVRAFPGNPEPLQKIPSLVATPGSPGPGVRTPWAGGSRGAPASAGAWQVDAQESWVASRRGRLGARERAFQTPKRVESEGALGTPPPTFFPSEWSSGPGGAQGLHRQGRRQVTQALIHK